MNFGEQLKNFSLPSKEELTVVDVMSRLQDTVTQIAYRLYQFLKEQEKKQKSISNEMVLEKTKTPESKDKITNHIHKKTETASTLNNVTLFKSGPSAFANLSKDIKGAKNKIEINMFSWAPDSTGMKIVSDIEKVLHANKNLKVKIQLDRMGMFFVANKKQDWIDLMGKLTELKIAEKKKVELVSIAMSAMSDTRSVYKLSPEKKKLLNDTFSSLVTDKLIITNNKALQALMKLKKIYKDRINIKIENNHLINADHSKVVIIDDMTYAGGMNFGDEYSGGYSEKEGFNGKVYPEYWKDYMMKFNQGPISTLYRNTYFNLKSTKIKELERIAVQWAKKAKDKSSGFSDVTLLHNKGGKISSPSNAAREKQITYTMQYLIKKAKKEVVIEHAYLQDQRIVNLIKEAANRNVQIKIIRSRPESKSIEEINEHFFSQLNGVENVNIYKYKKVSHTKALLVDGKHVVIGSCNLSTASLDYHEETAIYISGISGKNESLISGVRNGVQDAIRSSEKVQ